MTSALVKPAVTAKVLGLSWTRAAYVDPPTITPGYSEPVPPTEEWIEDEPAYDETVPAYTEEVTESDEWTRRELETPAVVVHHDDELVLTDAIPDATTNGWTTDSGPALSTASTQTRSAPRALYVSSATAGSYSKYLSGLDAGLAHRLTAWFRFNSTSGQSSLGDDNTDTFAAWQTAAAANVYEQRTFDFTPVGDVAGLAFRVQGSAVRIDDFTLTRLAYDEETTPATYRYYIDHPETVVHHSAEGHYEVTPQPPIWHDATVTPGASHAAAAQTEVVLDVKAGSIKLDEARAPYAEVTLTCAQPEQAALDVLDPRVNRGKRLQITVVYDWDAPSDFTQTRTFDVLFHARTVNPATGEVTIIGRSDEALLIDSMRVAATVDSTYANATDLRTLVSTVLGTFGRTLEAGTVTADITRTWNLVNLIPNPSFETNLTGWANGSGSSALNNETATTPHGSKFMSWTATTTGVSSYVNSPSISVTAGKSYFVRYVTATSVSKTGQFLVRWFNGSTQVGADANYGAVTVTGAATTVSATITAPAGATSVVLYPHIVNPNAGQYIWADGFMMVETSADQPAPTAYFDGNTPANAYYAYSWTGTANLSTSQRTRLDNRSPDSLYRKPGVKVWDWLSPIIEAAGLRLFCDEQRKWRLVDSSYAVAGDVRMARAVNLTDARDTVDLGATDPGVDGDQAVPGYADGVVVHYSWLDRTTGLPVEAYDVAGADGVGSIIEVAAPYPGPGRAAAALARAAGRGRVLDLGSLSDLKTTPGMDLVATMPGIPPQVGKVSSVEFDLLQGVMAVGSRGLINTPANAWLFAVGPWSAATGTWAGATGTN